MKIEMGESLFYSWLRHVKECQVVQTNWKPSPSWQLHGEDGIKRFMEVTDGFYQSKYGYGIYKNNSLTQLLTQAEVDAVGLCMTESGVSVYAVDVAFHEDGLNYGDRQETVTRVIKKYIRTALCMVAYFGVSAGEIIFASPKINNAIMRDLEPCVTDLNTLFFENGYGFTARIIANSDFNDLVLKPILIASEGVSDTSELFMRGYQLMRIFNTGRSATKLASDTVADGAVNDETLSELKIGKMVQTLLREALETGKADSEEVRLMLTKDYSKKVFGIDYPLLAPADENCDSIRYYTKPLTINGCQYRLCSQWFEVPGNNDRPFLLAWLDGHGVKA
jgi:hypothetical protein